VEFWFEELVTNLKKTHLIEYSNTSTSEALSYAGGMARPVSIPDSTNLAYDKNIVNQLEIREVLLCRDFVKALLTF
jgi:hypothetical protein